jgi:acetylornithine aminotransferase
MIAVELADSCTDLVGKGLEAGILLNVTQDTIVRLLPPLILSDAEADEIVAKVALLING